MKSLLIALNSSYIHTNPAVRSLSAACCGKASFSEYNINEDSHNVLRDILEQHADVVAFSCYIWNIGNVLQLAEDLKKAAPETMVVLGGPEASFRAGELIELWYIDFLVCGEAEESLPELFSALETGSGIESPGLLYKKNGRPAGEKVYRIVEKMEALPAPFAAGDEYDENKIYYYESSRGCPFSCAYCMSGIGIPIREKALEQVKKEIRLFTERNVKLVKFTDRTFNAHVSRAKEILRFVMDDTGETCFHFEVALDLMDEEMIALLQKAAPGKIQLEAGVQTTNARTLQAIMRKTDLKKVKKNAKRIMAQGNIHLHLDLIAGLPYEDYHSFRNSFNEVYSLYPDALQLGFLKLLPGTALREAAEQYGVVYRSYPPYEVIETNDISADELLHLKEIEALLNRYYNTGRARNALDFLTQNAVMEPFELYDALCSFCRQEGYASRPLSARNQFVVLIEFAKRSLAKNLLTPFFSLLRQDYDRVRIKGKIPEELEKNV